MRVKSITTWILTGVLLFNVACEKNEENSVINVHDYYGDGSYFVSLPKLKSPEVIIDHCGTPVTYELRKLRFNLQEFATVTVFGDGLFLNFQFDLIQDRIQEGWQIYITYVWVGLPGEWVEGRDNVEGGWSDLQGIDIQEFPTYQTTALHQILLEDWMFEDCFTIAVRVLTKDPNGNEAASDSFINHGDYLTYSWNEPFCLEPCDDPGTQSSDYWKNNYNAWPHGLTIGNRFYSIESAISTMIEGESSDDMTYRFFEQLAAAKLNVAIKNTSYCIIETIDAADAWIEEYGPVGNGVSSTSSAWSDAKFLYVYMINYNSGYLCANPAK